MHNGGFFFIHNDLVQRNRKTISLRMKKKKRKLKEPKNINVDTVSKQNVLERI